MSAVELSLPPCTAGTPCATLTSRLAQGAITSDVSQLVKEIAPALTAKVPGAPGVQSNSSSKCGGSDIILDLCTGPDAASKGLLHYKVDGSWQTEQPVTYPVHARKVRADARDRIPHPGEDGTVTSTVNGTAKIDTTVSLEVSIFHTPGWSTTRLNSDLRAKIEIFLKRLVDRSPAYDVDQLKLALSDMTEDGRRIVSDQITATLPSSKTESVTLLAALLGGSERLDLEFLDTFGDPHGKGMIPLASPVSFLFDKVPFSVYLPMDGGDDFHFSSGTRTLHHPSEIVLIKRNADGQTRLGVISLGVSQDVRITPAANDAIEKVG